MSEPEDEEVLALRRTPESVVALALISVWLRWPRSASDTLALKDVRREYAELTGTRLSDAVVASMVTNALNSVFGIQILGKTNRRLLVSRARIEKIAAIYGLGLTLTQQERTVTADLRILETMWSLPPKRRFPVP